MRDSYKFGNRPLIDMRSCSDQATVPQIISRHTAVFTRPPKLVPSTKVVDGPILGNGDVGVTIGGPPEDQQFFLGKNDLWSESLGSYVTVGGIGINIPELAGSSYRPEQDISGAEVAGVFERAGLAVNMRSYIPGRSQFTGDDVVV